MAPAARGSAPARGRNGRARIGRRHVMVLGAKSRKETANRRPSLERRPSRDSAPLGRIVRPTALQVPVIRYYDILIYCVCGCVCVCVRTYYTQTHTHTHTYTHTYIHIHIIYILNTHTHTHTHTHTILISNLSHTPLLTHLLSRSLSKLSLGIISMIYYGIL